MCLHIEHQEKQYHRLKDTSRNLEDLLNMNNNHFPSLVNELYSNDRQLNKASTSEKQANILD
jgi:hypothetical protein